MFELKILSHFSAAHQLAMVAKKCENLHGHNWKVEVCVKGERLNDAGVLVDFGILKGYVKEIMARLDHRFLNELPDLENIPPSSENLAVYIAENLQAMIDEPGVVVSKVTTWESDDACATYFP
ncbi:6-carboxytetrahydropterin synthase QueD [uncultured Desulfosarcina sp.]|uniref:6-carboxytetrahydropterin synthase QueD n=1 Tax=uncultured Desulfosarcina sp. TaxID=218289 RepID=UPI0029C61C96|nr:6-carboxytetrahydropterin synthase QueD [uncultured Desulfosarcina sp.]